MKLLWIILLLAAVLVAGSDGPYFPIPNLAAAAVALAAGWRLHREEKIRHGRG